MRFHLGRYLCIIMTLVLWSPDLNALELDYQKLENGEVLTALEVLPWSGDGEHKRAIGVIMISAPIEEVWQVICDWDAMPQYVPNMVYCKTVFRTTNERWVANRLKFFSLEIDYPLIITDDSENYLQTWQTIDDEKVDELTRRGIQGLYPLYWGLKSITGFNRLEPYDGNRTLYTYSPVVESKIPIPSLLEQYLLQLTLPRYMNAFKQRVESHNTYRKSGESL